MDAGLLLACLQAESGLNPNAIRRGVWPDVSGGLTQVTVATASGYGLGDGTADPANVEWVLSALCDRETAIDLGARILAGCAARAGGDPLQALIAYNSGSPQPEGNWYWLRYPQNIAAYRAALAWSADVLAGGLQ